MNPWIIKYWITLDDDQRVLLFQTTYKPKIEVLSDSSDSEGEGEGTSNEALLRESSTSQGGPKIQELPPQEPRLTGGKSKAFGASGSEISLDAITPEIPGSYDLQARAQSQHLLMGLGAMAGSRVSKTAQSEIAELEKDLKKMTKEERIQDLAANIGATTVDPAIKEWDDSELDWEPVNNPLAQKTKLVTNIVHWLHYVK